MHRKTPYKIFSIFLLIFRAECHSTDNRILFKTSSMPQPDHSLHKRNIQTDNNPENTINESYELTKGRPLHVSAIYNLIMKSLDNPGIRSTDGMFYSKWRHPNNEPVEFINNINIRGNEEIIPTWPARGRRSEGLINSSRSRREEDGDLFWGNRGRRSEDSDVFWGNRGKKTDADPFWGVRGKKSDADPFWGVRGKKSDADPFWGVRGKKSDADPFWGNGGKKPDEEEFWGARGKKGDEDPFWGNRGKKSEDDAFWGVRGKKSDDEEFWGSRGRRGDNDPFWGNRGKKNEDPFWGNRGKRTKLKQAWENLLKSYEIMNQRNFQRSANEYFLNNLGNHFKHIPERRSDDEQFWGNRGKRSRFLHHKKDDVDPFWGNRGKRLDFFLYDPESDTFFEKKDNDEDQFWGNRGKRNNNKLDFENRNAEKKNEEDPFWGNRGKRGIPFIDDENVLIEYVLKPRKYTKHVNKVQDTTNKLHLRTFNKENDYPQGNLVINSMPRNTTSNELIIREYDLKNNKDLSHSGEDESGLNYRSVPGENPTMHRIKRDLEPFISDIVNQAKSINKDDNIEVKTKNLPRENVMTFITDVRSSNDELVNENRDGSYNDDGTYFIRLTPNDKFDFNMLLPSINHKFGNFGGKIANNEHQNILNDMYKMLN